MLTTLLKVLRTTTTTTLIVATMWQTSNWERTSTERRIPNAREDELHQSSGPPSRQSSEKILCPAPTQRTCWHSDWESQPGKCNYGFRYTHTHTQTTFSYLFIILCVLSNQTWTPTNNFFFLVYYYYFSEQEGQSQEDGRKDCGQEEALGVSSAESV